MKIDINGNQMLFSLLSEDVRIVQAILETEKWKNETTIHCEVKMNGIEIPAEILEEHLEGVVKLIESHFVEKYADIEKEVDRRAKKILKEQAHEVTSKMFDLINKLDDIEGVIKPYWEKE